MLNKVKDTVKKYRLLTHGEKVLIGVSGGPDSVALLYSLRSLAREIRLKLCIGHLDHGLRKDSGQDAIFVKRLALKLGIPLISQRIKVKKTGSLEESARKTRLDFLLKAARKFGAKKIALGHNLDDQAETVLMRILRGSGLYGLNAILPKRAFKRVVIIRPLVQVRRKEIEAYLKHNKLIPRRDATNEQDLFLRNRMRNRLIPLLEKEYNPNIKSALANLAESSALDYEYLDTVAAKSQGRKRTRLNLKKARNNHPALNRWLFRRAIKCLQGDTRRITFRHIEEIEDLLLNRPAGSVVNLPKGLAIQKSKTSLIFSRNSQ